MASPNATPTPITPPRVPLIDERTGLISRQWYLFFLSLFQVAENNDSPNLGPASQDNSGELAEVYQNAQLASMMARYDECCQRLEQQFATQPPLPQFDEIVKQVQALETAAAATPNSEFAKELQALQSSPAPESFSELAKRIDALELLPPPREFKRARYGSFLDTTTQTATTVNTAKAITFNTTDLSQGVYIGSPTSRIYIDTEGVYDFQVSLQLDSTVSTDEHFYLWIAKNGTDVANSASTVRLKGNNSESILALNFFFDLKANDYIELMYSVTDLGVQILYEAAAPPVPAIPSIILTVNNGIEGV